MKLDRFRAPALAATAVLLISGGGIAFAGNPTPSPTPNVTVVGPSTQTGGTGQLGDQLTPDVTVPGVAAESATESTTIAAESATETAAKAGIETDGPGGHTDIGGQNVDFQSNVQQ
ncbi:MAG: hypothetical protein IVW53_06490 [Chloroflexi bacterium]|nr:hypothetical protein [Chloroflexota bacterium]